MCLRPLFSSPSAGLHQDSEKLPAHHSGQEAGRNMTGGGVESYLSSTTGYGALEDSLKAML